VVEANLVAPVHFGCWMFGRMLTRGAARSWPLEARGKNTGFGRFHRLNLLAWHTGQIACASIKAGLESAYGSEACKAKYAKRPRFAYPVKACKAKYAKRPRFAYPVEACKAGTLRIPPLELCYMRDSQRILGATAKFSCTRNINAMLA
jgi:hypothetical protein